MKITTPEQCVATLLEPSKHWLRSFDEKTQHLQASDKLHRLLHQSQINNILKRQSTSKQPFARVKLTTDQRKAISQIITDTSDECINYLTKVHAKPHHLSTLIPLAETLIQATTDKLNNGLEHYLSKKIIAKVHAKIKKNIIKLTLAELSNSANEIKDETVRLNTLSLYYHLHQIEHLCKHAIEIKQQLKRINSSYQETMAQIGQTAINYYQIILSATIFITLIQSQASLGLTQIFGINYIKQSLYLDTPAIIVFRSLSLYNIMTSKQQLQATTNQKQVSITDINKINYTNIVATIFIILSILNLPNKFMSPSKQLLSSSFSLGNNESYLNLAYNAVDTLAFYSIAANRMLNRACFTFALIILLFKTVRIPHAEHTSNIDEYQNEDLYNNVLPLIITAMLDLSVLLLSSYVDNILSEELNFICKREQKLMSKHMIANKREDNKSILTALNSMAYNKNTAEATTRTKSNHSI